MQEYDTVSQGRVRISLAAQYHLLHKPVLSRLILSSSSYKDVRPWSSISESGYALSATELALLSHYLTNTCCTIPFDSDEVYVLQVGIPNLAFQSRPLMASLLALAAASKAFDLVSHSSVTLGHLDEVRQLLNFADQHYQTSLREIQVSVSALNHVDHILANAALMVLYGLASHSVRIRVAQMARGREEHLHMDVLPEGSQWIYLIRAAHSAYVGLRHGPSHTIKEDPLGSHDSRSHYPSIRSPDIPALGENPAHSPEDGPSERTRSVFFPIVAATQASALNKLRARFHAVALAEPSRASSDPQIGSCFLALEVLGNITETIFDNDSFESKPSEPIDLEADLSPDSPLSKVSSWLRTYIARVTSSEPSKPLRRTVTAFLNLVPMNFITTVQLMLDQIPGDLSKQSLDDSANTYFPPCPKNQLALEIFAHWLVLVMLLDGVWWIGDTGDWELRRIISFMEHRKWLADAEESWWPKTMYNIRRDLF